MKDIKLGSRVQDVVSELTGIATCRTEYLNGCVRYGVDPGCDKDGKRRDVEFVDVQQLLVVDEDTAVLRHMGAPMETGGDRAAPQNRKDPPRT